VRQYQAGKFDGFSDENLSRTQYQHRITQKIFQVAKILLEEDQMESMLGFRVTLCGNAQN
jgi:hypothetical protein